VACKGCVLIVDDDPDLRSALAARFEDLGCNVVAASDGVHAMECLGDSLEPCLVLMDMNMPRLGGAGLVDVIRAQRRHCGLQIVSMSAGADRLEPPLVARHLSKPFEFGALKPILEAACRDRDWLHGER
jgi:CheY-like chemotaxis protein